MQKNYPFFETTLPKPVNGIFQKNNVNVDYFITKIVLQRFFALCLLLITGLGYSQTEAFESGIPVSWAINGAQAGVQTTFTNNWVHTPTGGYLASGGATVNPASNNTVGTMAEYFLITNQIITPVNGEIRFYTKQGSFTNRGGTYQIRISTANQNDISSYNVVLASWTEAQLNVAATTYQEKVVPIPTITPGTPIHIAFVAVTNQTGVPGTSGDSWFVDDVRVISSCTPVTAPMIIPSADGAAISWTHPTATQFGIDVVPTGAGHSATGTPTDNSYDISGLAASTTYDVYIITNCDASTNSVWAGPFSFTTTTVGLTCPTAIVIPPDVTTTPYVLSANLDQFYDGTTYVDMNSQGMSCQPSGQTMNLLSGNHVYLTYTPTTSGLINITQVANTASGGGGNNCYNTLSSVFVFDGCAGVGTSAGCLGAIATSSNGVPVQIPNFYAQAGQTYLFVISSPYQHTNPGAGICFTFTISGSSCPAPSQPSITIDNLQQTTATASWDNVQNLVSAWQYLVLPATSPAPTSAQSGTDTNTNVNNPISSLTPGLAYNLYVRSMCGTPGEWSAPRAFTTQCNVLPLPYYTGFTNANTTNGIPEPCWTSLNLNNDLNVFHYGASWNSEPVAKLRTSTEGQNNDMLVTPKFNLDGVTQKRLRFKYNVYGNWGLIVDNPTGGPGSFEIKLSTTGVGASNFTTTIVPLASYTTAYNFIEMIVPIPNITGNINIAWIVPPGALQTGNWLYIDDVYIEDLPACSEPAYPVVTPGTLDTDSVEISWTNGYQNTQWELVAQPLGSGVPTATPAPGAVVNIVSTNPYTITGLNPSTQYEFYMRAYCSASEQSIWVGPIQFNTLCIEQPTPYYESFNDPDPNTKKFCWSTNNANNDNAQWIINATDAYILPQPISFFDPFVSYNDWLISVPVNAVGPKRLRFNYRVTAGVGPIALYPRGNFEVLMSSTADFATYTTLIPSHDFTNESFEEDSVLFTGTGTTYIAFRMPPNMPNPTQTGRVTIDDFIIEDAPACPNPNLNTLTATNITPTSADLSWTPGSTETQWEVVVQSPLSGVPTGSGVTVNTTPTYQATLTENTAYEYYVRAICNDTESSEWVGPFPFRSTCNALPTPFTETFDSDSQTETCWTVYNNAPDDNTWNLNQTMQPMFGNQMAALFTGTNGANNDWLITPTLTAHAGQRLRFYYRTLYSGDFEEDLKVIVSTNGVAISDFTSDNIIYENNIVRPTDATGIVQGSTTLTLTSVAGVRIGDRADLAWQIPFGATVTAINGNTVTISQGAYSTIAGPLDITFVHEVINSAVVREKVIDLTGITADTNINIGFHTPFFPPNPWNYRGQYTFIDNVIIEDIPVCPEVINVSTSNILDVSAVVNWESTGTETSWEISVQPYGTPAPTGDTLPAYLYTANAHPYTVTGLTPSTLYQYYVRAVCSDSAESVWVGPFEILTRCDFTNVCEYTISVTNGNTGTVTDNVTVMQNGTVMQALEFPGFGQPPVLDYTVFLCQGVEFSLYWNGFGSGTQYSEAQIVIKDAANNIVWTSPLGLGLVNTTLFTGVASCGVLTCPQPTNLAVSNQGVFSWTPGGSETQWEVFVQPYGNGTIPQSGTIVNSPSYTPVAADFINAADGTFEYLVRAVCSSSDKSYWSGPKVFIRNDEPSNAVRLQVNTGSSCDVSGADASFITATASTVPTSCPGVNSGDIWYDFIATSKVHIVELSDFAPGTYYTGGYVGAWPQIMMSLYEVQGDGSLVEKGCSNNNSFVAKYSSELVVGNTYKIRLTLNDPGVSDKTFHICVTTPEDLCDMDAFNYSFEKLPMQSVTGVLTIINSRVTPGWRTNTDWGTMFFLEGNNIGVTPYEGGQCLQLTQDGEDEWDPSDPNIKGLYKDFDTSQITMMDFSFASATRQTGGNGTTLQLFAGPPSGPFTVIAEDNANSSNWDLVQGTYDIPVGQTTTRFIFRTVGNAIGHLLDAANFKANVDIEIDTADTTLDCNTTAMAFDANGVGVWEADVNNPGTTTIETPNSGATNVSGFTTPGSYIFHWKTAYCDRTITITKQGTTDTAQVTNPTIYCVNAVAVPLTATVATGNTINWYTQANGGVGTTTAPTPSTTTAGNSQVFYAAAVDANGCEGPRAEIVVQVNDLPTATISGATTVCEGSTATITFNGTPNAVVTYTVNGGSNQTITLDATGLATLTTAALTANASYDLVSVTSVGTNPCSQAQTGNALVTVETLPTATISGTTDICEGSTATITFNGTANATVTYTVDGGTNQTIVLNGAGTATVTTPVLTVNSVYTLVSVTASGTLACNQTQTGTATVTVNALPTATISGTTSICSGATAVITFTGTPNAIITYTVDGGANQTIILNGSGTATITTPALSVNSTYALVSVASGTSTCNQTATGTAVITVGALPTATITGTATVCQNAANPTITFTGANGAEPYTFTYTINGGANQTLTTTTGNSVSISVPTTTVGVFTYDLLSVASAGLSSCSQTQSGSAVVTVEALPTATISGTTTICTGLTATITFNGTANATVTYTVNGGANQTIVLDGSGTATITTTALTATTTYALVSVTSSSVTACSQAQTGSAVITVNQLAAPNVTFSYADACINATANPLPILPANFTAGGAFSSTSVTVNPTTGAITSSTVGSHQITYTLAANTATCTDGGTFTATIVISDGITPVTGFSYDTTYCANAANALPTTVTGFTTGGTFSATGGLIINPATGEINIEGSDSGNYTITYTVPVNTATCNVGGTSTFQITIGADLTFAIDASCQNSMLTLDIIEASFNTDAASYTWTQETTTVGTNASFNVDEYLAQNPSLLLPLTFTVSIELNGCDTMQSFTVSNNPCRVIPRGISPNNDQVNDTFDLTGYGVKEIVIFNRYGTKVFSYSGNYTNQWKGQSDGGDELPDATYFYSIHTNDGTNKTGWVYINRQY